MHTNILESDVTEHMVRATKLQARQKAGGGVGLSKTSGNSSCTLLTPSVSCQLFVLQRIVSMQLKQGLN